VKSTIQFQDWIEVPPVFIVGSFRSGTSLLRLMLCAHPNVWISGEGSYFYRLRDELNASADFSRDRLKELHKEILPFLSSEKWISLPSLEELLEWTHFHGVNLRSIMTFYNTWDARALEKNNLQWWGDNAPYHIYAIPYFDHLFPKSKFIHMIRDPRDIYTSIRFNYKETYRLEDVLNSWYTSVDHGLFGEIMIGQERFLRLKYESLVTEPEQELRKVCEFLKITFTDEMLTYHKSKAAIALSGLVQHENVTKPVFATSVGKFRTMLAKDEIDQIISRYSIYLRCLGYLSESEYVEASASFKK
jgi:protein-tyrosine sulfotransferase